MTKKKPQDTKRITIYQRTVMKVVTDVDREIDIEVPASLDTETISEEQLEALIEHAFESGSVSDEQAEWRHGYDHFPFIDYDQITSEVTSRSKPTTNKKDFEDDRPN